MKCFVLSASLVLLFAGASRAQTFGVLLGGSYKDLYAGGKVFGPAYGVHAGAFLPFYVNDRFVVRAEVGTTVLRANSVQSGAAVGSAAQMSVTAALVARYHASRLFCFSVGIAWVNSIGDPSPVAVDRGERIPARTDLNLVLGASVRCTPRVEVGIRFAQGLQPAMDAAQYGMTYRRYGSIVTSYLLRDAHPTAVKRHGWHSNLGSAVRY